jgi:AcrR family transcriptional regulator
MPKKTNRRDLIVDAAAKLFIANGYNSTSTRQIAEKVGLTEASIYYHFKHGKRELFKAVLETNLPDLMLALDASRGTASLHDFIARLGEELAKNRRQRARIYRWISAEVPRLSGPDLKLVQQNHLHFHAELVKELRRFIKSEREANHLAWFLSCAILGYVTLFVNLELEPIASFSPAEWVGYLADLFAPSHS